MRYLGLDLGSKSLGISISDKTNTIASLYKTIYFDEDDYDYAISCLKEIIDKEEITALVLGYPKNMNNTLGKRALITLEFKKKLEDNNYKVYLEDERLTSVISNNVLITGGVRRKKRKLKTDGMSAQLILQSYLDKERNGNND